MLAIKYEQEAKIFALGVPMQNGDDEFIAWITRTVPFGKTALAAFGRTVVVKCFNNPDQPFMLDVTLNEGEQNEYRELDRVA